MKRRVSALAGIAVLACAATASGATINVPSGGNLQQALNQAQPGDTILLAAGATYTGNFVLPAKNGTAYITIRSAAPDSSLPAPGQRITPDYVSQLPKLQAPAGAGGTPPLATAPSASFYVIQFVEFLPNPSGTGSLLALGSADSTQNTLAVVPHDIVVDRCYLHGAPGQPQLRGIALNSGKTTIRDSYIAEIKYAGNDAQAIAGWNGTGPYTILNNYLQATGENFMLGGSSMFIPNATPTNIEFRNNYVTKDPSWRGSSWTVKNLFELKHAQDVVVDGNVFEYNWQAAQPGYAIVLTPRNQYKDNPWTVVQRVTFTNNLVRHVSSALNVLGWDDESGGQNIQTNHLTFRNNVLEDVSASNWGGSGRLLLISETPYVTIDHNTVFNDGSAIYAYYGIKTQPNDTFVFTNNIVNVANYGIIGDSVGGSANSAIAKYFPGSTFADNLFVACSAIWDYPAANYFPASYSAVGFVSLSGGNYHLASTSPYKGYATDSTDPGADIDKLNAAQASSTTPPPPPPPADAAPTVSISSPSPDATFTPGATISITASAADGDSTPVHHVDFYADGKLLGTATSSPYTYSWMNAGAGTHALTAVAVDTAMLQSTSPAVIISVSDPVASSLPAPWSDADVGAVGVAGSASYGGGTFTVSGAGGDIWGTADAFNFVSQSLAGDGQIVARVASVQNTDSYAKAGVMIRETLASGSSSVVLDVKPGGGTEFMVRSATGGSTSFIAGTSDSAPVWLKLVRAGNTFTAYSSHDGAAWTSIGSTSVAMAANVSIGLAVSSHSTTQLNTSTFDNVTTGSASGAIDERPTVSIGSPTSGASFPAGTDAITITATATDTDATPVARVDFYAKDGTTNTLLGSVNASPYTLTWTNPAPGSYSLTAVATDTANQATTSSAVSITVASASGNGATLPAPWSDSDIGIVGIAGSASYSSGTFTIIAEGSDIWGTADAFHYVYQPLSGDGQIVARVTSLQNTDTYAKAGVMIRASLQPDAANALLDARPGGALEFLARQSAGASTVSAASIGRTARWLKIARSGATLTAYVSGEGKRWTPVGSIAIAMPQTVYIGLAVCSHKAGQTTTATIDKTSVVASTTTSGSTTAAVRKPR